MKTIVLLISTTLVLTGCKKEKDGNPLCGKNDTEVEMHIVEYGTQTPIEGAEVYLVVTDDMGNNPSVVDSYVTDHSGLITWPCDWEVESICAQKPDLYYGSCGQGYSITMSWVADGVYELYPHAWVKVSAVDDEPLNPNLFLRVSNPIIWSSDDYSILYGNDEVILPAYGNLEDVLYYSVRASEYPDSILQLNQISVFSSGFDTTSYVIHY